MSIKNECFSAQLKVCGKTYLYYPVSKVAGSACLPYALKILLENVLRNAANVSLAKDLAGRIVAAGCAGDTGDEVEFCPARVLFQDFTGVPVFVDFALMREACLSLGGDPAKINPQIPCDLVIDHSVIADSAGNADSLQYNMQAEFRRNHERYNFLKWAQQSFDNVRIVPPGSGICHQLNIEQFARVVMTSPKPNNSHTQNDNTPFDMPVAYFDTLVGTDSHTPTANGIGVLGWGVGGIEAEAAALGQPITTLVPRVVGMRLSGKLSAGVSAMDVALSFAQVLRSHDVVGAFVECFGPGLENLSATQRTCISNMTPEYGNTATLFPVDSQTLEYLRLTGRDEAQVALVEAYAKAQGFWGGEEDEQRIYAKVIDFDLSAVVRSLAGPARPHDRIELADVQKTFRFVCEARNLDLSKYVEVKIKNNTYKLTHGTLAIAAVTSCTTATDPRMMIAAGLLAKKAHELKLYPKPWVKCILAPGSKACELLLKQTGLLESLCSLGFYTCGFGCMSCIGNSGPLADEIHAVADDIELASILSGNRNFEGRISPDVSQNYLAAPAEVIAYALVGTLDCDLVRDILGYREDGSAIYLSDLWPSDAEIDKLMSDFVVPGIYREKTCDLYVGTAAWQALDVQKSDTFVWDTSSTYVRRAPYFDTMTRKLSAPAPIEDARVLAYLGDFITTDHISPAGSVAGASPAARYLEEHQVAPEDFNTYGSRRGNHEVMMRGTFANVKLQNLLAAGVRGGWTYDFIDKKICPLFDAAMHYRKLDIDLVILAGKMYGSGSSRDWAAKGPALLGVRAVFAESFERIHRSNLIGMGILPLQFLEGESAASLGLNGYERYSVARIDFSSGLPSSREVKVSAKRPDGSLVEFLALVRIDTPTEGAYFANGGILQYVLRRLID